MARSTTTLACVVALAALVLVVSAADKPFVTVTAVGHLGKYTSFNYSGAADITVDKTTGQIVSSEGDRSAACACSRLAWGLALTASPNLSYCAGYRRCRRSGSERLQELAGQRH